MNIDNQFALRYLSLFLFKLFIFQPSKVYGWNTLEVIALECGNPSNPVHAIPPSAWARCHIRYVVGSRPQQFITAVRKHLDANGIEPAYVLRKRNDPKSLDVIK